MATSSQDQPAANPGQNQAAASKRFSWLRLVIVIIVPILVVAIILVLLTYFKVLPQHWFAPLLATLGPIFGALGAFINNALLSNKDFQQSFSKWLSKRLFGDTDEKDGKNANTSTQTVSITIGSAVQTQPVTSQQPVGAIAAQPSLATSALQQQSATGSTTVNPLLPSDPIFFPNMKLPHPREFYGRGIERSQLLSRTRNGGCTSIIGPRRSGKTWLMTYLRLVAADLLGENYHIGYLSAALPTCDTIARFTREALKALGYPPYSLPEHPDLTVLQGFVGGMIEQKETPIICIDEFEGLTHRPAFDLEFFEGLRAITEIGLGLVVLSKEPLIDIVSEATRTSPFFNVFLQLPLAPFDRADALQFLQNKGTQAQFTDQDRSYLLAYAQTEKDQFPPLRLQLVGEMLLNDKRAAAAGGAHYYRPNDPEYWQMFKERVDTTYKAAVKS